MVRQPPSFVVTTPESLYLLVTSARGRERAAHRRDGHRRRDPRRRPRQAGRAPRAHASSGSRRCATGAPTRIGLSATQRPIETVGRLLVGDRPLPAIVDVGHQRDLDLALELPDGELEAVASAEQMGDVLDRIAALVGEHRTTLVFVNTRRLAERLAHQLGERLGDDVVAAHHGSLSKERRHRVETPPAGRRPPGAGGHRLARARHRHRPGRAGVPDRLAPQHRHVPAAGRPLQPQPRRHAQGPPLPAHPRRAGRVHRAAGRGARPAGSTPSSSPACRSTSLAQQIVAEVGAQEWRTDDLFDLVRRAAPYTDLTREQFDEVRRPREPTASRPAGAGAAPTCTTTRSTASCGPARAPASPRSPRAAPSPRPATTGSWPSPTTRSSAPSTRTGPSSRWRATSSCSARTRGRSAGSRPAWCGCATPATRRPPSRSGWARHRPAPPSCPPRCRRCATGSTSCLAAGDPDGARRWLIEVGRHRRRRRHHDRRLPGRRPGRARRHAHPGAPRARALLRRHRRHAARRALALRRARQPRPRPRAAQEVLPHVQLRAAGGGQRRRHRALARPAPQLPARRGAPLRVAAARCEDTLEHAILDSPMFQARWRWNLNRSLMVLRFRDGRRNPPPIQRMESDDLHGRGVPAGGRLPGERHRADRDPRPRARAPDRRRHAARGARRRRPRARCSSASRRARCTVHCADTTEPSVLAHEIVTARPYAFLDDEEFQNRRTNAVTLRRGWPSTSAVDRRARPRGHRAGARRDRARARRPPTTCTTCSSSLVVAAARADWRPLFDELAARGRGARSLEHDGAELWCAAERATTPRAALAGDDDAVAARRARATSRSAGITTVDGAGRATTPAPRAGWRCGLGRASQQRRLRRSQGRLHARRRPAPSGWPGGCWPACTRTRAASRRDGVEPATAQDFMRFLLRWQHVAPGTQLAGEAGLARRARAAPGLRGRGGGVGARAARRGGCATTSPAWLDRLCHDGEVAWLRLTPRAATTSTRRSAAPSKATPISVVLRADLPLAARAARRGAPMPASRPSAPPPRCSRCCASGARASPASWRRPPAGCPTTSSGPVGRRGPRPASCPTGSAPSAPGSAGGRRSAAARRRSSRLAPRAAGRRGRAAGGRSCRPPRSLVPRGADRRPTSTGDELAEAVAEQLLHRWGVVFRDLAVRDSLRLPWRDLQWALRRLEDRGLVRGGRFVAGFSGEQYALPAAVEQLDPGPQGAPHRRAGHRQRHRPAQPRRRHRARRHRARRAHQPGHLRRRRPRRRAPTPHRSRTTTPVTNRRRSRRCNRPS